jgi:hypothetical protein
VADEAPKLHIDSDWKDEVERERQKMAEKEQKSPPQGGPGGEQELPPADFKSLMGTLVTPAMLYLGGMPDPQTGQAVVSLELARHYIDLLALLEDKCKGNLTDEESEELGQVLNELRKRFVEIKKHVESLPPEAFQQGGAPGGAGQPNIQPPPPPPTPGNLGTP